jgi:hypothetical protein
VDLAKDDFFEHIAPSNFTNAALPTATPAPAVTPMPTTTPMPSATLAPTPQPAAKTGGPQFNEKQKQQLLGITSILYLFLSAGALIVIKKQRDKKNRP